MLQPQQPYALAFDTSAYTTSVALVGRDGHVAFDGRTVLHVPSGQRGLRQSEALFQHVANLPALMEQGAPYLAKHAPACIVASTAPRNLPDSYMPVFRAGHGLARSLAATLGIPLLPFSHQEGHLWAAFLDTGITPAVGETFLAVHISGGTTEALRGMVMQDGRIALDIVGQAGDLTAGKFIDRVGVALGLGFPAGPAVERMAEGADPPHWSVRPAVRGSQISFSGPLTAIERNMSTFSAEAVAQGAQTVLAQGLAFWARHVVDEAFAQPPHRAYWVGGVAANRRVQSEAHEQLVSAGINEVLFAQPKYSTDNAVGVAYYAATRA